MNGITKKHLADMKEAQQDFKSGYTSDFAFSDYFSPRIALLIAAAEEGLRLQSKVRDLEALNEEWSKQVHPEIHDAIVVKLKARVKELESAIAAANEALGDQPDYHSEGMGCGLEDRSIHDRYEVMRYGWDEAMQRHWEEVVKPAQEILLQNLPRVPESADSHFEQSDAKYSREGLTLLILHLHDCDQYGVIDAESPDHLWFSRHGGYYKLSKATGEVETLREAEL